jgi:hypothetical protein
MKSIQLLSFFLLLIVVSSCSKSNDPETPIAKIDGQWKLVYFNGSFTGASYSFEPGIITWTFNPITQKVFVVNNNTNTNLNGVLETGIYDYQIIDNPESSICTDAIKVGGTEMGCVSITTDNLDINQTFDDGFQVHFIR